MHTRDLNGNKQTTDSHAIRPIIKAILNDGPAEVCFATSTARLLSCEHACTAARQAFLRDFNNGCKVAAAFDGGLLHAVFKGLRLAQSELMGMTEKEIENASNGVVTLACVAAQYDEPLIVEVLFRWEPAFTMKQGRVDKDDDNENASTAIETALFFEHMKAPQCAAFVRKNHPDGMFTHPEKAVLEKTEQRLRREAIKWIRKLKLKNATINTREPVEVGLRRALLHDVKRTGCVSVISDVSKYVFTVGLCLLGKPELACCVEEGDDRSEIGKRMEDCVVDFIVGRPVETDNDKHALDAGMLNKIIAPFAELRPARAPAVRMIRVA